MIATVCTFSIRERILFVFLHLTHCHLITIISLFIKYYHMCSYCTVCHYDSGVDIFYIFIYGEHLCGRDQSLFWTLCLSLSLQHVTQKSAQHCVLVDMTKEVHSSASRSWHNSSPPSWHLTSTTPWIKYLNSSMWHHLPMITWQISPPPCQG